MTWNFIGMETTEEKVLSICHDLPDNNQGHINGRGDGLFYGDKKGNGNGCRDTTYVINVNSAPYYNEYVDHYYSGEGWGDGCNYGDGGGDNGD